MLALTVLMYTYQAFGVDSDGTITFSNSLGLPNAIESAGICVTDPPLPSHSVEIIYDDGCWDSWGYNVQNSGVREGWSYQGVRVKFTTPSTAGGILLEARLVDSGHFGNGKAKIVIYDKDGNYVGEVEQELVANGDNFQVIDVSSLRFVPGSGNDFYIAFEPGGDICVDGPNGLGIGDDSSTPSGRSQIRSGNCNNSWRVAYNANHLIRAVVSEISPTNCFGLSCTINGKPSETIIQGTNDDDVICGTDKADIILGNGGNDTICGGVGDDVILAGNGHDRVDGGAGNDVIDGGNGIDMLDGGEGNDVLLGGNNSDLLYGGMGFDYLSGGLGKDMLNGGPDDDICEKENSDKLLVSCENKVSSTNMSILTLDKNSVSPELAKNLNILMNSAKF